MMGLEMARKARATERPVVNKSQQILTAAIRVFAKKGYFHATVSDVARAADVAEGTIYLYYKNKEDLLISIFEHSMDLFIETARQSLVLLKKPEEKFRKFVELHLKLVEENQDLAHVLQIELRASSKFMKEYRAEKFFEYLSVVKDILEEGKAQGVFRKDVDVKILPRCLFGAVDEMALEWIFMTKKKYSLEQCAAQVCEIFLNGMRT